MFEHGHKLDRPAVSCQLTISEVTNDDDYDERHHLTKMTFCIINDDAQNVTVIKGDHLAVFEHLIEEWINCEVDLHHIARFMAEQGVDLGIADDEIDEGTDCRPLALPIRAWVGCNNDRAAALLAALEPEIRVRPESHADVAEALEDGYDLLD